jgi:hypothetical protein
MSFKLAWITILSTIGVGRALLSAGFDLAFGHSKQAQPVSTRQRRLPPTINFKGGGQECPPHTPAPLIYEIMILIDD